MGEEAWRLDGDGPVRGTSWLSVTRTASILGRTDITWNDNRKQT